MKLAFTKMQGAGNDFVVIDGVTQAVDLNIGQVKRIADRRRALPILSPDNNMLNPLYRS